MITVGLLIPPLKTKLPASAGLDGSRKGQVIELKLCSTTVDSKKVGTWRFL